NYRLHDPKRGLESEIYLFPVELGLDVFRSCFRIIKQIAIEFRQINRKRLRAPEKGSKRIRHYGRMAFVPVYAKCCVSSLDIPLQCLQSHLLSEPIHLICRVRKRPIHGLFERVHCLGWQLNVTLSGLAVFQLFDVFRLQSETFQVRKLRRIAELSKRKIVRKLAKLLGIRRKLEIFFRSRLHIDGAEDEHFIWRAGFNYLGKGLSISNCRNLIFVQPNIVAKEFEWFNVLGIGRRLDKRKQKRGEEYFSESDCNQHCLAAPFKPFLFAFISCPTRATQTALEDK